MYVLVVYLFPFLCKSAQGEGVTGREGTFTTRVRVLVTG